MADMCTRLALLLTCVVGYTAALPWFLHGRPRGGMLGSPGRAGNGPLPPDQWVTQRLDHYNDADLRTWQQRYFVNDTFFKPGGPVFLMIGGEGTADPIWMVTGAWIEYAKEFHALCVMLEHRYYGKSHPTKDTSVESLQYLSSEQALADLAYFRNYMVEKRDLTDNKWISFGGSYPGSLSAWFRLKYPHLVAGAVATSGPLLAELDFVEYVEVVRDSLATTGPECNKNIQEATDAVKQMLGTQEGVENLSKLFNLCSPLDVSVANDVANFWSTISGNFMGVVQYNKDNREFEGAVGTNITLDVLCNIMNDVSMPLVDRYAAVNSLMMKTYQQKCLDISYSAMVKELRETSWESAASEGGRQWIYQTCTEFGFYQTSDSPNQPFGDGFPLSFSLQQCSDIYGPQFNQSTLMEGIKRTNTNYGALKIAGTKIVFPNGSIDPWHALGITKNPEGTDLHAVYIKGTAHCANMYPARFGDPPELAQARETIKGHIQNWLSQ
ncbi:putative serine protease F56F10.1 [Branchiostoma lanceolatum]|uniref:putative serine protease F56F10.1 n=1 Tax=Branchiostoma lanceolatum TaxID=7740 RepID=UPI0034515F35